MADWLGLKPSPAAVSFGYGLDTHKRAKSSLGAVINIVLLSAKSMEEMHIFAPYLCTQVSYTNYMVSNDDVEPRVCRHHSFSSNTL